MCRPIVMNEAICNAARRPSCNVKSTARCMSNLQEVRIAPSLDYCH
jgi:hypothetical protein